MFVCLFHTIKYYAPRCWNGHALRKAVLCCNIRIRQLKLTAVDIKCKSMQSIREQI